MKAAVTDRPGVVTVAERPEPPAPAPGETILRIEAVGICGSDLHLYRGDLGESHHGLLPRVQGHEVSAVVEVPDPAGPAPGCAELAVGDRVVVWPVVGCGRCRMCAGGRANVCRDLAIIGVHRDGALQELVAVPTANVVAAPGLAASEAVLAEPASISVHAVERGRVRAGERIVVLGAGPIGATAALAAAARGADVVVVDPVGSRRDRLAANGFEVTDPGAADLAEVLAGRHGSDGPHVVIDTTGRADVLATAIEVVGHGGRIVVVGLTAESAPLGPGALPLKELDVLGVSCCHRAELAAALDLLRDHRTFASTLVSHVLALDEVGDAFEMLDRSPHEVSKVLVDLRDDASGAAAATTTTSVAATGVPT
ncbi:MAG: alcohol dehydrogenase catalytic domain-containing protein [Actinomycetota bacterium]|nr:alcohol dehydrogenase catalytic domain-containing protein [Actinomycetota bacterium]